MRAVNGKRECLVAWTPTDEGETFNNSWEPTKNVGQPLIDDFWARQKRQLLKSVDVSPLDERVPETIATRVLNEDGNAAFGREHTIDLGMLALQDVADDYIDRVASRFGLEVIEDAEVKQVFLHEPEHVGDFCNFEKYLGARGHKNLRHRCGRKSNMNMVRALSGPLPRDPCLGTPHHRTRRRSHEPSHIPLICCHFRSLLAPSPSCATSSSRAGA